ncbi:MAG TPA: outer membrane lipoprotein-sorting protein [Blastocatellia bacterium]|nr:outer membrane lipoprotein-sorting protein [Blastocatellia bacterium]
MIRRHLILLFASTLLLAAAASAQTVDDIIKKNVEARGGLQKIKAIKSLKMTGKITLSGPGVELPLTIQQKRPGAFRMDATFQGQQVVQAYDGENGWQINPGVTEPEKMAGDDLKEAQEQADIDGALIDYKEKGHTVELLGKEDVEGTPAYKLKVTLKSGDVRYIYIDAANSLELKVTAKRRSPGGEQEVDIYPGNYKAVAGVLFPHSIEQKIGGQTQVQITIDKIETDAPIDDALFKMPVKPAEKPKTDEKPKEKPPTRF